MSDIIVTPEYWAQPYEVKYTYIKIGDATAWNVGKVEGEVVHLWTINAWGQVFNETCARAEFEQRYRRYENVPR